MKAAYLECEEMVKITWVTKQKLGTSVRKIEEALNDITQPTECFKANIGPKDKQTKDKL